jgi:hypothetical protein
MVTAEENKIIKEFFAPDLKGIVKNSGGCKALFYTKYNLIAVMLTTVASFLYWLKNFNIEQSIEIVKTLNSTSISLLSGIVGLSLAGLTLIITFSNPYLVNRGIEIQVSNLKKQEILKASYFQKAIAKFSFIVFFQIITLIVFFISSIFEKFGFVVTSQIARCTNGIFFTIGFYLITFSLILVVASIFNLFTFSQTSNFVNFCKAKELSDKE